MEDALILVRLDTKYCNYLRKFDDKAIQDKNCLTKSEEKYIKLLKEQLFWLNRNTDGTLDINKKTMLIIS